ncbi:MAG: hypothetical protein MMC23_004632 [Stictis urceolatum]|nr:hypothetical protein [Stictis urceolata]
MSSPTTPFLPKGERNHSDTSSEDGLPLEDHSCTKQTAERTSRSLVPTLQRVAIFLFAAWGIISLCFQLAAAFNSLHSLSAIGFSTPPAITKDLMSLNECDCGKSIAEARSMGCVYDSLAAAWLPRECRDDELTAEFDSAGPGPNGEWPYFADAEGKRPITVEQVAAMGDTFDFWYSTKEWHVVHCNFYWQKRFRMRQTGTIMERRNDHIAHVKHCGMVVLDGRPKDALVVKAQVVLNSAEE